MKPVRVAQVTRITSFLLLEPSRVKQLDGPGSAVTRNPSGSTSRLPHFFLSALAIVLAAWPPLSTVKRKAEESIVSSQILVSNTAT